MLQTIIGGKIDLNSVIHTDRWRGYDGLVVVDVDWHFSVDDGNKQFVSAAKMSSELNRFRAMLITDWLTYIGAPSTSLRFKETELTFNHLNQNIYLALFKLLRCNLL